MEAIFHTLAPATRERPEQWEPCEPRGSRTVLRAAAGAVPAAYSLQRTWHDTRDPSLLVARLQCTRDRYSDIAAAERFAKHIDHPCGLRALAQLRTTVAAHEYG